MNESPTARRMIVGLEQRGSPSGVRTFGGRARLGCVGGGRSSVVDGHRRAPQNLSGEVLDDGAERDDGEVGEADDDHDDAGEQPREQRRVGRERPADGGDACLRPSDPPIASTGIISMNRPTSIDECAA